MSLEPGIELSDSETLLKMGEIIPRVWTRVRARVEDRADFELDFEFLYKRQVVVSFV